MGQAVEPVQVEQDQELGVEGLPQREQVRMVLRTLMGNTVEVEEVLPRIPSLPSPKMEELDVRVK